jgi:hypothetical protein
MMLVGMQQAPGALPPAMGTTAAMTAEVTTAEEGNRRYQEETKEREKRR